MSYTQDDYLLTMSYMLGETSVPSAVEDRKQFIQKTLDEAYRYTNWDWNKTTVTLPLTSGIASLPSYTQLNPDLDVRVVNGGTNADNVFTQVPYEELDLYGQGNYKYWLTGSVGSYLINSTEADSTLTVRLSKMAPIVNASITSDFPSTTVIAQGALRYYYKAQDPEYDVSQDQALFQQGLEDLSRAQHRNRAVTPFRTRQQVEGTYTGSI